MSAVYIIPGVLAGGVLGWFIIRPVNAVLGFLFGGFNRWFDWMTALYGRAVGRTLRLSAMVLVIYAGLLGMTYWQFQRTPTGFIPQQDKGYLLLNVQLPDSASVERTQARRWPSIERLGPSTCRASQHTVGLSGQSLILNANAPNLGSMYILLKPFEERHDPKLSADAIAKSLEERCHEEVRGAIVAAFGAPPIDGLGTTGGFKLIVEDRGNLGLDQLQRFSEKIVARGGKTDGLTRPFQQFRGQHALAVPGNRPHQVHVSRRAGQRHLQHAAGLPGFLLREQFQRIRQDLASEHPGRSQDSAATSRPSGNFKSATAWEKWSAWARCWTCATRAVR